MKTKTFVACFVLLLSILFSVRVFATTPDPIIEYQLGAELSGVYHPKAYANCWATSMGNQNYYIGPFIPDPNTHLIVVRFLSRQTPVGMGRYTKCEAPTNVSAEQRAEWLISRDSSINRSKVKIYYVDGSWDQVTLTVTPSHSVTSTSSPTSTRTSSPTFTPTPIPAPDPIMVFTTGYQVDSNQIYAPRKNDICWTWNHIIGRIGDYWVPSGKQLLVIKFLDDQPNITVNNVICENHLSRTPEERASWAHARESAYYPWSKIVTFYVTGNMIESTLTSTPTITLTPSQTHVPSATNTVTITPSSTLTTTSTSSPSSTITKTSTRTFTSTKTKTRTSSPTRTSTRTPVPVLEPDKSVPATVSMLHIPKKGDICFGEFVEGKRNSVVEYTANYSTGVEISGGGCFTKGYFNLSQVLRYLEGKGLTYGYVSLPKPTLTPSKTLPPTATIVSYLAIGIDISGTKEVMIDDGLVCWGRKVGNYEYKSVRFSKNQSGFIRVISGGCTIGQNFSAEDVYNYLRRTSRIPLNGFLELK